MYWDKCLFPKSFYLLRTPVHPRLHPIIYDKSHSCHSASQAVKRPNQEACANEGVQNLAENQTQGGAGILDLLGYKELYLANIT